MSTPSPIPSDLLEPDPPFDEDELLASLEALFDEAVGELPEGEEGDGSEVVAAEDATEDKVRRWSITGLRSMEWAMSKLAEYQTMAGENRAQAEQWRAIIYASVAEHLERIDAWEAAVNKPLAQKVAFFDGHLTRYGIEHRTERQKSFKVPSGTVQTTAPAPTFEIPKEGQAGAVEYARKHDLPVQETTTITALKKAAMFSEVAVRLRDASLDKPPAEGTTAPPVAGFRWLPLDGIEVEWVPIPVETDVDGVALGGLADDSGVWRVTDTTSGEIVEDAEVWDGPFILDTATGEPLPFLTPKPTVVTAKVVLA